VVNLEVSKNTLPCIATPSQRGLDGQRLSACLLDMKSDIINKLNLCGAILFRGFDVGSIERFEEIGRVFCDEFGDYVGGNSPRTRVSRNVFTSTEYPKDAPISMHNEASYLTRMPRFILFYCITPADSGGQTPIADCRRILERIDSAVREKFERHGLLYVRNMHGGRGFGRSWMDVFCTKDRDAVEARLRADDQLFEWSRSGGLRTFMRAPATARHPTTHENTWINQAEQWHPSSLGDTLRAQLLSVVGENNLPHNVFLGDQSAISESDLKDIRGAMVAEERLFEWQKGDFLICDNILVMHGRRPYTGNRKVVVAMG
jgi:Taurine catabolism dioxygenase TauD, TfdA family